MDDAAIAVFTSKSADDILRSGGSGSWLLNPRHARECAYLVCVRNAHAAGPGAEEPHRAGFLVGKISGLVPLEHGAGGARWRIVLSAYARIARPGLWGPWRNPVRYTSLAALEIAAADLAFEPMPKPSGEDALAAATVARVARKLTIAEAKEGLAATFGVGEEAIEILIRG